MNNTVKSAIGGLIIACFSGQMMAQAPMIAIEDGGKKPIQKLDTAAVPQAVRTVYYIEYPAVAMYDWYGYASTPMINECYDYDSGINMSKDGMPEYYVSEFKVNDTPHKAIYTKAGKKVATHKNLKNATFPMVVFKSFEKSKYKNWKETDDKIEIIKEADKSKLYKMTVTKGKEKHSLYFDEKGKMVKDVKLKM